jgi:hypothetical protein
VEKRNPYQSKNWRWRRPYISWMSELDAGKLSTLHPEKESPGYVGSRLVWTWWWPGMGLHCTNWLPHLHASSYGHNFLHIMKYCDYFWTLWSFSNRFPDQNSIIVSHVFHPIHQNLCGIPTLLTINSLPCNFPNFPLIISELCQPFVHRPCMITIWNKR